MLWIVDNSFRFTFSLLFLPSYSPELLPAIPDSFSPPDPSPVPVAVHPPRHTLQAATIFAGFPEQLPPFSKESQVIRDSCHLFPAKTVTAIHKSDKFLYIWELQDKISRNILQNPNRQNYGNRPEMDCCPY